MAKYTIHHTCGHEDVVQLYDPNKEREKRIEWLESQPCLECRLEGTEDLKGSEKQRAWAGEIRRHFINSLPDDEKEENVELIMEVTDSSWWIDRRENSLNDVLAVLKTRHAIDEIAKTIDDADFPPLKGSEKQTAWARALRKTLVATMEHQTAERLALPDADQMAEQANLLMRLGIEWIVSHEDASWFIDRRNWVYDFEWIATQSNSYISEKLAARR